MNINFNRALRITTVLLAQGVLVYGHFLGHNIVTIGVFVGLLVGFLILSHIHLALTKEEKIAKARLRIEQKNADRKAGKWVEFKEDGAQYVDLTHPFSGDLNLFGPASLFQYLNDTNTQYGSDILKLLFLTDKRDEASVVRRQDAIKEVSGNQSFCETLKATGMLSKNISKDPAEMVNFFESKNSLFSKAFTSFLVRTLPVAIILFVILNFIVGYNNVLAVLTGVVIILQVMVFVSLSNKTEGVLKELSKFGGSLDDFGIMVDLINETKFTAELNQIWQNKLPAKWSLKKITWALRVRNITLLDLLLNILFLWDIHCVHALERMRAKGAKDIRLWLEAIGYFEAVASVANLPMLYPDWAYPEFGQELIIKTKNLGHPLIEEFDRVTNDFELQGIAIISGSNMSGKTTFLRTIGINLVLGYMGSPVCARKFQAPVVELWTCMKPPDNLKKNISTFYAELLRIKNIIDNEKPMLFLIDEIFAGTNSEDRIEGAKQVLLNLSKRQNLGLVTTHDLEVCKTEGFENYHFNESYLDDEITFDFKIKSGISTTRNARYLMKRIGIDIKDV
jgi:DNA mismatch repair ATPase MutS